MSGEVSKKILWVFIFLILTAIAVLGVLFIRGYQSGRQVTSVETTPTPPPVEEKESAISLVLAEPSTDVATSAARIALSGQATPGTIVVITGGAEDVMATVDTQGTFTATPSLLEGVNILTIQAYTENGDSAEVQRTIIYTKGAL